jgi:hypothetical protein
MKEVRTMAQKAKEAEGRAVTPWRPFMDLTRWETGPSMLSQWAIASLYGNGDSINVERRMVMPMRNGWVFM